MKIIKILVLTIVALVLLSAAVIFLFLKTFDVNKYKPQIVGQIKNALGRDVGIDNLALSLSVDRGISLGVQGLTIADDPQFSNENFLTVKEVSLGVDILTYLNKRQILVSSIDVKSPEILLIRGKDGQINAQTFKPLQEQTPPASGTGPQELLSGAPSAHQPVFPVLLVKSIQVKDGRLIYRDKMMSPEVLIDASQLFLTVNNLSLTDPFNFSLEGSLWSKIKNVGASGVGQLNIQENSIQLSNVKATSNLSDISVDTLVRSLPMLEPAGLKRDLKGALQVFIDKVVIGSKGLMELSAKGSLDDGQAELKNLSVPVSKINIPFEATQENIKIKDASLYLGSGKVSLKGDIAGYLQEQKFHFLIQSQDINLEEVVDQKDSPVRLTGKLNSHFDIDGHGLSRPELLTDSLEGSGTIDIKDGKLIGINVLRLVLDRMSMFPDLAEKVKKNLSEKHKESLNQKDTVLNKVSLNTFVKDGSLMVEDARVETDTFNLSGKGTMTFSQELNLQASVAIPKELSQSMAMSAEGLEYLRDDNGEILIPVSVQGRVPNLRFVPDLEYLGKKVLLDRGKEELQKVLEKTFGKDKDKTPAENQPSQDPQGQNQPVESQDEKSPEQQLIEGVLDRIFK